MKRQLISSEVSTIPIPTPETKRRKHRAVVSGTPAILSEMMKTLPYQAEDIKKMVEGRLIRMNKNDFLQECLSYPWLLDFCTTRPILKKRFEDTLLEMNDVEFSRVCLSSRGTFHMCRSHPELKRRYKRISIWDRFVYDDTHLKTIDQKIIFTTFSLDKTMAIRFISNKGMSLVQFYDKEVGTPLFSTEKGLLFLQHISEIYGINKIEEKMDWFRENDELWVSNQAFLSFNDTTTLRYFQTLLKDTMLCLLPIPFDLYEYKITPFKKLIRGSLGDMCLERKRTPYINFMMMLLDLKREETIRIIFYPTTGSLPEPMSALTIQINKTSGSDSMYKKSYRPTFVLRDSTGKFIVKDNSLQEDEKVSWRKKYLEWYSTNVQTFTVADYVHLIRNISECRFPIPFARYNILVFPKQGDPKEYSFDEIMPENCDLYSSIPERTIGERKRQPIFY